MTKTEVAQYLSEILRDVSEARRLGASRIWHCLNRMPSRADMKLLRLKLLLLGIRVFRDGQVVEVTWTLRTRGGRCG